jgi:hypothetical protein
MYACRLMLPAAIDLERDCAKLGSDGKWQDHPLGDLANEVDTGRARASHLLAAVRAGLHSDHRGSITPSRAAQIVADLAATRPLIEAAGLARLVLIASLTTARIPGDRRGKRGGKNQALSRGDVLANCAAIGVDWEALTLAAYAEVMTVQQQRNPNHKPGSQPPSEDFMAMMRTRFAAAKIEETAMRQTASPPNSSR